MFGTLRKIVLGLAVLATAAQAETASAIFSGSFQAKPNVKLEITTFMTIHTPGKPDAEAVEGLQVFEGSSVECTFNMQFVTDKPGALTPSMKAQCVLTVGGKTIAGGEITGAVGRPQAYAGTMRLDKPGPVALRMRATGTLSGVFDRTVTIRVIPRVTIPNLVPTVNLPTQKPLTVTSTPGPTVVTGGFTTAPTFGPAAAGTITVPDVRGGTPEAALQKLRSAGFTAKVELFRLKSDLRNPQYGQVFEQSPAAGSRAKKDAALQLKVYGK